MNTSERLAAIIAHAREDVPWLLTKIAQLRDVVTIVRDLAERDPIHEGETFVGFYCDACDATATFSYDGFDAEEHARIQNACRESLKHAADCIWIRARRYTESE